jgi:subtilisin family serine protease
MWGLEIIEWHMANDQPLGENTIVAVIDSGVDYNHEDMVNQMHSNRGYDFVNNDNNPMDDNGHGTHVAGTIAAGSNNRKGTAGVAPQAKIMAIKGLDWEGLGYDSDLAAGTRYAADNGADVINNSWGAAESSSTLQDAVIYAKSRGVVIVSAAGNENSTWLGYPASFAESMAIAATDYNDQKASFSNYGDLVDVAAPGVGVLSLRASGTDMYGDGTHIVDNRYYWANGTSMSSPHAAGLAAAIISKFPSYSVDQVVDRIISTTDELPSDPGKVLGSGRINITTSYSHSYATTSYSHSYTTNRRWLSLWS